MKKVFKYPLDYAEVNVVPMIAGANIIHVGAQNGIVTMWALVSDADSIESRRFRIIGTGHELPKDIALDHIGSCVIEPFVWHVFEELSAEKQLMNAVRGIL